MRRDRPAAMIREKGEEEGVRTMWFPTRTDDHEARIRSGRQFLRQFDDAIDARPDVIADALDGLSSQEPVCGQPSQHDTVALAGYWIARGWAPDSLHWERELAEFERLRAELSERVFDVIGATGRLAAHKKNVEERIRAGRALVLKGAREKGRDYEILIEAIEGVEADEVVAGRVPRRDIVSLLGYWADQARDWDYFCYVVDMGISGSMHRQTMSAWAVCHRLAELVGRPLAETVADAVEIPMKELRRQRRLAQKDQLRASQSRGRCLIDVFCTACADTGWVSCRCVRGSCGNPACKGGHRFTAHCSCRACNPRIIARQGSVSVR